MSENVTMQLYKITSAGTWQHYAAENLDYAVKSWRKNHGKLPDDEPTIIERIDAVVVDYAGG